MSKRLWCFLGLFVLWTTAIRAGDWPQILGPNRNGLAAVDEKLADSWPAGGPAVVWSRNVGEGFAGVVVVNDRVVLFHREDHQEIVEAIDAATGKTLWKSAATTTFSSGFSDDRGPRCTPLVIGDRVVVFGAQGLLRCLDLKTGQRHWQRATHAEFSAPEGYFGAGSSPIAVGNKVLVNVGANKGGAGIVAFDLASGKTVWQSTDEQAGYSSPVAVTVNGVEQVIFVTRLKTLAVDPQSGKVRFEFPFGKRGPTVNAASPVVCDGHLFVTAHYGVGAVYTKLGSDPATAVWESDDLLSSHYMTPLCLNNLLFGVHGQERVNEPELRCLDPRRQKVLWSKSDFGYGAMIAADGKAIAQTTEGDLILWRPSEKKYEELARTKILKGTTRAIPALSNGRLFVRDTTTLKCVRVGR